MRSPSLSHPGTSTFRSDGWVQARERPEPSGRRKWVFSKTTTSPAKPGSSRIRSTTRFTAATLVIPWFHHWALTLMMTTSSRPTTAPAPPSEEKTASTFSAGVPPWATWILARSRTGSSMGGGGAAENDSSCVYLAMVRRTLPPSISAAPPAPATARPPSRKTRRDAWRRVPFDTRGNLTRATGRPHIGAGASRSVMPYWEGDREASQLRRRRGAAGRRA
jgi:hypothetical protein